MVGFEAIAIGASYESFRGSIVIDGLAGTSCREEESCLSIRITQ